MSADITRINEWMYSLFKNNASVNALVGGRIYSEMAPQGATFPLVLFAFLGGSDKVLTFRSRFTNGIYLVRAVDRGSSYATVEPIADSIDTLLATVPDNGIVIRDIRIASCNREQPHQRKDQENGVPTVYLGGFYRVRYQPNS